MTRSPKKSLIAVQWWGAFALVLNQVSCRPELVDSATGLWYSHPRTTGE
jgi:hypothetical protein